MSNASFDSMYGPDTPESGHVVVSFTSCGKTFTSEPMTSHEAEISARDLLLHGISSRVTPS